MDINSDIENKLLDIIKEILTEGYHGSGDEDTLYLYLNDIKGILEVYIKKSNDKLNKIQSAIDLAEKLCYDQSNKIIDGSICISAMKSIRRYLKE